MFLPSAGAMVRPCQLIHQDSRVGCSFAVLAGEVGMSHRTSGCRQRVGTKRMGRPATIREDPIQAECNDHIAALTSWQTIASDKDAWTPSVLNSYRSLHAHPEITPLSRVGDG